MLQGPTPESLACPWYSWYGSGKKQTSDVRICGCCVRVMARVSVRIRDRVSNRVRGRLN